MQKWSHSETVYNEKFFSKYVSIFLYVYGNFLFHDDLHIAVLGFVIQESFGVIHLVHT